MPTPYLNIQYKLDHPVNSLNPEFLSIWKVIANDSYGSSSSQKNNRGFEHGVLFFTWEGNGVIEFCDKRAGTNMEVHDLKAHSCLFLDPRHSCRYFCKPGAEWKFFFLRFTDRNLLDGLQLTPGKLYSTEQSRYLMQLCEKVIQCLVQRKTAYAYEVNGFFYQMMSSLAAEQSAGDRHSHANIEQVIYWMHQNLDKPARIDDLTALAGMSRSKFFYLFKRSTGLSPVDYFLRLKLDSARLALETTNQAVKAIAESLHFLDPYYFSKAFKKQYGSSPSEYRNKGL